MQNQLDRLLAAYCSPTLAGIKPASLVSCDRNLYPDLPQRLCEYRAAFDGIVLYHTVILGVQEGDPLIAYGRT